MNPCILTHEICLTQPTGIPNEGCMRHCLGARKIVSFLVGELEDFPKTDEELERRLRIRLKELQDAREKNPGKFSFKIRCYEVVIEDFLDWID